MSDNPTLLSACQSVLGGVAAFIAYGRLFVRRIAPASISTFRALQGIVVLGALVLQVAQRAMVCLWKYRNLPG
jgi:hypothetical protein